MLSYRLGQRLGNLSKAKGNTVAGGKMPGVDPTIIGVDTGADPLPVTIRIPPYDPATRATLQEVTVIVLPMGAAEAATPEAWLATNHPRARVTVAPPGGPTAAATLAPPPTGPAGGLPPSQPVTVGTGPAGGTATAQGPAPAVLPALPGPAGGDITIPVAGVPDGQFEIQLILGDSA